MSDYFQDVNVDFFFFFFPSFWLIATIQLYTAQDFGQVPRYQDGCQFISMKIAQPVHTYAFGRVSVLSYEQITSCPHL